MIDERQQELASLYAFDLLEGAERVEFEAEVARSPELRALVAELRETTGRLAFAAPPAVPPADLKRRVLASIDRPAASAPGRVVAFPQPTRVATLIPWALAAGFALCTLWFGSRYYLAQADNLQINNERELATLALRAAETRLEAERLASARLATDFTTLESRSANQLADAEKARAALEQQLAQVQGDRGRLSEQLAAAQKAADRAHAEAVALSDRLKQEGDLARLKIATLASMLGNSPKALAVAVWDPSRQQGVFTVDQLAANTPEQRYELWVIDKAPVSAGVFTVGADGRARLEFKPVQRVQTAAKFAVSREKNDGQSSHAAPAEVVMISE